MALLEQNFDFISIYTGFHGSCDHEPCVPFDLRDNPHKDMIKLVTQTHFGRTSDVTFKPEVEDNQWVTNDFVMIECGKICKIYLKPGLGSFEIPGFVVTDAATTEERYVTDVCTGEPPTQTPTPTCNIPFGPASFKPWPQGTPVRHTAGGDYNWCAGTIYFDPGVRGQGVNAPLVDCNDDEVCVTTEYWTNRHHAQHPTAGEQITDPDEIAKLGLDDVITADGGATIGPAPYSFGVYYIVRSCWGSTATSGRAIHVHNQGDPTIPSGGGCDPDCDPCGPPPIDCCDPALNSVTITAETELEFGSPKVTASAFSYSGELCMGNGSVGIPKSVNLYVPNYAPAIGVVSFFGELDSSEIYFEVTDDPHMTNNVPVHSGDCLKGIVDNDQCILQVQ